LLGKRKIKTFILICDILRIAGIRKPIFKNVKYFVIDTLFLDFE
jgi:hypothetical protein